MNHLFNNADAALVAYAECWMLEKEAVELAVAVLAPGVANPVVLHNPSAVTVESFELG